MASANRSCIWTFVVSVARGLCGPPGPPAWGGVQTRNPPWGEVPGLSTSPFEEIDSAPYGRPQPPPLKGGGGWGPDPPEKGDRGAALGRHARLRALPSHSKYLTTLCAKRDRPKVDPKPPSRPPLLGGGAWRGGFAKTPTKGRGFGSIATKVAIDANPGKPGFAPVLAPRANRKLNIANYTS